jgi:hypothetical protein
LQTSRKIDDGYDDILSAIDDLEDFDKIKDILDANRANIADGDCKLVATEKYIINNGTDMNQELTYFTNNGLKQVSIVEEDKPGFGFGYYCDSLDRYCCWRYSPFRLDRN